MKYQTSTKLLNHPIWSKPVLCPFQAVPVCRKIDSCDFAEAQIKPTRQNSLSHEAAECQLGTLQM